MDALAVRLASSPPEGEPKRQAIGLQQNNGWKAFWWGVNRRVRIRCNTPHQIRFTELRMWRALRQRIWLPLRGGAG